MTLSLSPQRLLEGGTDHERQLLAASDGYVPSADAAARVAAALRATAAGAVPAAPVARLTASGRLLKPALGLVGGGILAALLVSQWPEQRGAPDVPALTLSVAVPELAVPEPAVPLPPLAAVQEPQAPEGKQPLPKAAPLPSVARRPPPVSKALTTRAQHGASDLAAELRAIDHIRTLLGWGQVQQAEAALRAYRASFPHGELALEADLSSVDVALAQGDRTHARALARELLERPGASRYRARLSSLLDTNALPDGSKQRSR